MRGTSLLHNNWSSPSKTLFLFIIYYNEAKLSVSSALWPPNGGENNGKTACWDGQKDGCSCLIEV